MADRAELTGEFLRIAYEKQPVVGTELLAKSGEADLYVVKFEGGSERVVRLAPLSESRSARRAARILRGATIHHFFSAHPNICSVEGTWLHRGHLITVMPRGACDLYTYLKHFRFTERAARTFFQQLIKGVAYLHAHGVAHRDIKLQNVLLDSSATPMLIDFGYSTLTVPSSEGVVPPHLYSKSACGTPGFSAPEVVTGHYDPLAADMYSLGVVLYAVLYRRLPDSPLHVGNVGKEPPSPAVVDLLHHLLHPNPRFRPPVESVLNDVWVEGSRKRTSTSTRSPQTTRSGSQEEGVGRQSGGNHASRDDASTPPAGTRSSGVGPLAAVSATASVSGSGAAQSTDSTGTTGAATARGCTRVVGEGVDGMMETPPKGIALAWTRGALALVPDEVIALALKCSKEKDRRKDVATYSLRGGMRLHSGDWPLDSLLRDPTRSGGGASHGGLPTPPDGWPADASRGRPKVVAAQGAIGSGWGALASMGGVCKCMSVRSSAALPVDMSGASAASVPLGGGLHGPACRVCGGVQVSLAALSAWRADTVVASSHSLASTLTGAGSCAVLRSGGLQSSRYRPQIAHGGGGSPVAQDPPSCPVSEGMGGGGDAPIDLRTVALSVDMEVDISQPMLPSKLVGGEGATDSGSGAPIFDHNDSAIEARSSGNTDRTGEFLAAVAVAAAEDNARRLDSGLLNVARVLFLGIDMVIAKFKQAVVSMNCTPLLKEGGIRTIHKAAWAASRATGGGSQFGPSPVTRWSSSASRRGAPLGLLSTPLVAVAADAGGSGHSLPCSLDLRGGRGSMSVSTATGKLCEKCGASRWTGEGSDEVTCGCGGVSMLASSSTSSVATRTQSTGAAVVCLGRGWGLPSWVDFEGAYGALYDMRNPSTAERDAHQSSGRACGAATGTPSARTRVSSARDESSWGGGAPHPPGCTCEACSRRAASSGGRGSISRSPSQKGRGPGSAGAPNLVYSSPVHSVYTSPNPREALCGQLEPPVNPHEQLLRRAAPQWREGGREWSGGRRGGGRRQQYSNASVAALSGGRAGGRGGRGCSIPIHSSPTPISTPARVDDRATPFSEDSPTHPNSTPTRTSRDGGTPRGQHSISAYHAAADGGGGPSGSPAAASPSPISSIAQSREHPPSNDTVRSPSPSPEATPPLRSHYSSATLRHRRTGAAVQSEPALAPRLRTIATDVPPQSVPPPLTVASRSSVRSLPPKSPQACSNVHASAPVLAPRQRFGLAPDMLGGAASSYAEGGGAAAGNGKEATVAGRRSLGVGSEWSWRVGGGSVPCAVSEMLGSSGGEPRWRPSGGGWMESPEGSADVDGERQSLRKGGGKGGKKPLSPPRTSLKESPFALQNGAPRGSSSLASPSARGAVSPSLTSRGPSGRAVVFGSGDCDTVHNHPLSGSGIRFSSGGVNNSEGIHSTQTPMSGAAPSRSVHTDVRGCNSYVGSVDAQRLFGLNAVEAAAGASMAARRGDVEGVLAASISALSPAHVQRLEQLCSGVQVESSAYPNPKKGQPLRFPAQPQVAASEGALQCTVSFTSPTASVGGVEASPSTDGGSGGTGNGNGGVAAIPPSAPIKVKNSRRSLKSMGSSVP